MRLDSIFRIFRKKCRTCAEGRLKTLNWIRATCVDEQGRRYPDSWTYRECDRCGARVKVFFNGTVAVPTEEEWSLHCKERGPA
jgi:hypothetical protein